MKADRPAHNGTALALYLATVLSVPFCAPLMHLTGGIDNPGLFNACVRAGTALSTTAAAALIFGPWLRRHGLPADTLRPLLLSWPAAFLAVALTDTVLIGHSAQHVDLATTLVVQELHPITTMLLSAWLLRGTGLYRTDWPRMAIFLPLCLLSLVLLTGAEAGSVAAALTPKEGGTGRIAAGLALAAAGTTLVSSTALANRHCLRLATDLCQRTGDRDLRRTAAMLYVAMFVPACLVSAAASLAVAAATGEHMTGNQLLLSLAVTGMAACFLGSITWRTALLLTDRVQLHAMLYLNGPSSLAFLWAAGLITVASPAHLAAGAALAIGANILLSAPRPRRSRRARSKAPM